MCCREGQALSLYTHSQHSLRASNTCSWAVRVGDSWQGMAGEEATRHQAGRWPAAGANRGYSRLWSPWHTPAEAGEPRGHMVDVGLAPSTTAATPRPLPPSAYRELHTKNFQGDTRGHRPLRQGRRCATLFACGVNHVGRARVDRAPAAAEWARAWPSAGRLACLRIWHTGQQGGCKAKDKCPCVVHACMACMGTRACGRGAGGAARERGAGTVLRAQRVRGRGGCGCPL
jgi:hypothetical protein